MPIATSSFIRCCDVGDVSAVAAEWGRHGTELTDHGNALREHRTALQSNWTGHAAEPAANRLGELGDRTSGTGRIAGEREALLSAAGHTLRVRGLADENRPLVMSRHHRRCAKSAEGRVLETERALGGMVQDLLAESRTLGVTL